MKEECKVTINIASHGYEGQFEIFGNERAYVSGPFQEKIEIQTSITRDLILECWKKNNKLNDMIDTLGEYFPILIKMPDLNQ